MTETKKLARLAALAGIVPSYRDAWGYRRHVPESTQRALLAAMGLRAEGPEQIERQIREIEEAPFRRVLDRVLVVKRVRGARIRIPIALSTRRATGPIEWRFEMESGVARDGRLDFKDLSPIDKRAIDGETVARRALTLPFPVPLGYHNFRLFLSEEAGDPGLSLPVIVVPARCRLPRGRGERNHIWGITLQLYGLRSRRNWGIGDYTDLASVVGIGGRLGASAIGFNPLHALFPANPLRASPYSPSHRQYLRTSYLDVEAVPDFAESDAAQELAYSPEFRATLDALRATPLVDYERIALAKRPAFEAVYRSFCENHLGPTDGGAATDRAAAFRRFQRLKGQSLEQLGLFQALSEHFGADKDWRQWPAAYRDPESPEVASFGAAHRERIEFFQYLQWQADQQLAAASAAAEAAGMPVGLYHDLALAPDGDGAETWANQTLLAQGVRLGAPPDEWNHKGQNWGLPPYNPCELRAAAYRPFGAVIRANMQHAGALRLDHAMSLERLYWIPEGAEPQDGGYVRYPVDDLIGVLALESHRHECLVIGEDLGTLPEGFQQRMRSAAMLSYRLLYFSQDEDGRFSRPQRYPAPAAVAVGTHDLATLAGYWHGRDLDIRTELGLYPSEAAHAAFREERARKRRELIRALKREDLLPTGFPEDGGEFSFDLVTAIYRFLARTPARLLLLNPDDVFGEENQINMPGTTSEHPNWKRKMLLELERLENDPRMVAIANAICEEREHARRSRRGGGAE
jgi:(1->4)-alpha-D-glucan 1-alpha-D-glucosylmutase